MFILTLIFFLIEITKTDIHDDMMILRFHVFGTRMIFSFFFFNNIFIIEYIKTLYKKSFLQKVMQHQKKIIFLLWISFIYYFFKKIANPNKYNNLEVFNLWKNRDQTGRLYHTRIHLPKKPFYYYDTIFIYYLF